MIRGSEILFRPGMPFDLPKDGHRPKAKIKTDTMKCIKCNRFRIKHTNFQDEGDTCRYCRKKPRKK